MRENCTYGSEGGEARALPYPYHKRAMSEAAHARRVTSYLFSYKVY